MKSEKSTPIYSIPPPTAVRGMTILERASFQVEIEVPYLLIPKEKLKAVQDALKPYFLKMRMFHPVRSEENKRKVILNPLNFKVYEEKMMQLIHNLRLDGVKWGKMQFSYQNWFAEDIIKAVLPSNTLPTFNILRDIIVLHLTSDQLSYRFLIGQVLLDKYSNVKTVINQSTNLLREFKTEHLAGEQKYHTLLKQDNFQYEMDLEKICFNPLIIKEYKTVVDYINPGDKVFDIFAGVGFLAIPLAEKKCRVYANDSNLNSYRWLKNNMVLNNCENLKAYNLDEELFIRRLMKKSLLKYFSCDKRKIGKVHIIMDLSYATIAYLQYFNGLLSGENIDDSKPLPIVHCYFHVDKENGDLNEMKKFVHKDSLQKATISTIGALTSDKILMYVRYKLAKKMLFSNVFSASELLVDEKSITKNPTETLNTSITNESISAIRTDPGSSINHGSSVYESLSKQMEVSVENQKTLDSSIEIIPMPPIKPELDSSVNLTVREKNFNSKRKIDPKGSIKLEGSLSEPLPKRVKIDVEIRRNQSQE